MNKQEALFSYLSSQLSLDKEIAQQIEGFFTFVQFEAGKEIIRMGAKTDSMYLVLKGLVRAFYIDENGSEITKCFAKENEWFGFYSYLSDEPSPFFVETLEKTEAAVIKTASIRTLCQKMPALAQNVSALVNQAYLQTDKKAYNFASKEAKERYIDFARENPEIIKRAKQEHIASYLGITPSSLSRLNREIKI
ncbi:MAG: Crp/Fnr family transcriptional regulator [Spirochaetaceae bacterium]|nr:Crp/Fnr family transcriptional regulator [Spirochaetaceae bacterium]